MVTVSRPGALNSIQVSHMARIQVLDPSSTASRGISRKLSAKWGTQNSNLNSVEDADVQSSSPTCCTPQCPNTPFQVFNNGGNKAIMSALSCPEFI